MLLSIQDYVRHVRTLMFIYFYRNIPLLVQEHCLVYVDLQIVIHIN